MAADAIIFIKFCGIRDHSGLEIGQIVVKTAEKLAEISKSLLTHK